MLDVMAGGAATILHADLDAFYASVELTRRPELRGRPLVVGGGVVLAATYEARRFGVHAPMPVGEARRRCPGLVVVGGRFADYAEASRRVFAIFRRFTPVVEPLSIDEAFLETAGVVRLFGPPTEIARRLKAAVREEAGLPLSVGVARTKFLAKVASRRAKPDGLLAVDPQSELAFLHPLPVGALWGVGPVTEARLARFGIRTVGELAELPSVVVDGLVGGELGAHLRALAWNRDPRPVVAGRGAGSVGAQSTFGRDVRDGAAAERVLLGVAERVGRRLRRKGLEGRRITVRVRFADFDTLTRSSTVPAPLASTTAIFRIARRLTSGVVEERGGGRGLRLLGISVSLLRPSAALQLELPCPTMGGDPAERPGSPRGRRLDLVEHAADRVEERFGAGTIRRASLLPGPPPATWTFGSWEPTGRIPSSWR